MKNSVYGKRRLTGTVLAALLLGGALYAFEPTAIVGVYLDSYAASAGGVESSLQGLKLAGLFGWNRRLPADSFLSLSAAGELRGIDGDPAEITDREQLDLQFSSPLGSSRLEIQTGLDASVSGAIGSTPFLNPDWMVKYRLLRDTGDLVPYIAYQGDYFYSKEEPDDVLYQGGELGFAYRPTIRFGNETGFQAGYENWLESYVKDSGGNSTDELRKDLILQLDSEFSGLIGYFTRWSVSGQGGLRISNGNRYLDDLFLLDENSESRWYFNEKVGVGWSPHRQFDLQLALFGRQVRYLDRNALTAGGGMSDETLRVDSAGLNLRCDVALNDRLFLVADWEGSQQISNDPDEEEWISLLTIGIEYSF